MQRQRQQQHSQTAVSGGRRSTSAASSVSATSAAGKAPQYILAMRPHGSNPIHQYLTKWFTIVGPKLNFAKYNDIIYMGSASDEVALKLTQDPEYIFFLIGEMQRKMKLPMQTLLSMPFIDHMQSTLTFWNNSQIVHFFKSAFMEAFYAGLPKDCELYKIQQQQETLVGMMTMGIRPRSWTDEKFNEFWTSTRDDMKDTSLTLNHRWLSLCLVHTAHPERIICEIDLDFIMKLFVSRFTEKAVQSTMASIAEDMTAASQKLYGKKPSTSQNTSCAEKIDDDECPF